MSAGMRAIVLTVAAGAVALGGAWWTYQRFVGGPLLAYRGQIAVMEREIGQRRKEADAADQRRAKLKDLASRTLGRDDENVVHRLRVSLSEIGRSAGLSGVSVGTKARGDAKTLDAGGGVLKDAKGNALPDFRVVAGSLRGEGTLAQALAALAMIESQAWPMRVKSVSLLPRDAGARVDVNVSLETLYFADPDLAPAQFVAASPADDQLLGLAQSLASRQVFSPPAPPPTEVARANPPAQPTPAPAPPPPPPYDQWKVNGLVSGQSGDELWIVNTATGERRVLVAGQAIFDVQFEGLRGRYAALRSGDVRFDLLPGETLAMRDRAPATR